ncbi:hypothetical protein [Bacillus sp. AFS023182]|nr:hypothetical protein [Bacillus sp. AFS023182]
MENKQQRDKYEREKVLEIIKTLKAKGLHKSGQVVFSHHFVFITLAK